MHDSTDWLYCEELLSKLWTTQIQFWRFNWRIENCAVLRNWLFLHYNLTNPGINVTIAHTHFVAKLRGEQNGLIAFAV